MDNVATSAAKRIFLEKSRLRIIIASRDVEGNMHFNHCGGFFETVQYNLEIHDNTVIDFRSVSLYYSTFFLTEDVVTDVYAILIIPLALPVTNITGQE